MHELETILESVAKDPVLTGYLMERLARSSPEAYGAHARDLARAAATLDEATAMRLAGSVVAEGGSGALAFLSALSTMEARPAVRARAVACAARLDEPANVGPFLMELVAEGEHPHVLASALSGLARVPIDLSLGKVKPFLVHPDARVRASALEALLSRDMSGLEDLLSLMANDPAPRVKSLAAVGLWRLGHPDLLEQIDHVEDPPTRRSLLYALGLAGPDPRGMALLELALEDPDEAARRVAIRALARVATGLDVERLLTRAQTLPGRASREDLSLVCYRADAPASRRALARLIVQARERRDPRALSSCLGLARAWPAVTHEEWMPFLDDADGRVVASAVELLAPFVRIPSVRRALWVALDAAVPRVAATAAVHLWRSGDSWALHRLKELIRQGPPAFRASAAWALGQIGGFVAERLLAQALSDPEDPVRRAAFEALGQAA